MTNIARPTSVHRETRVTLGATVTPIAGRPAIELRGVAQHVTLSTDSRTITGTITAYETPSTTQGVVIHEGALSARQPLERVKLLRDHNPGDPVGYMTDLSADGLEASFYVPEGPGGDQALSEAQNHLRDGLSVGFHAKQYAFDDDYNLHVYEGELYEVSLCAIPDFQDAQVTNVAAAASTGRGIMTEAQLRAALAAGTITQAEFDVQLAALGGPTPQPEPAPTLDPALTAGPTPLPASVPLAHTAPRPLSLTAAAEHMSKAFQNMEGDRNANVRLALADIVPSSADAGTGYFGRADWIGELWTASAFSRPWIDAIGAPAELTTWKRQGYKWVTKPTVDEYAGEKAQVPTSTATTDDDTFTAFRIAGGWDIDRVFIDLANDPGYIEAFWNAAMDEYKVKSDAAIQSRVIAAATAKSTSTSTTAGIIAILKQIIRDGRAIKGSNLNRIFLGDTLFTMLEDLNVGSGATIPLWLKNANITASISDATASVEGLTIAYDAGLAATQSVYFDTRALKVREKAPIQLKAFDVAHAGIDLGLYSYLMLETNDPRLIMKRTAPTT